MQEIDTSNLIQESGNCWRGFMIHGTAKIHLKINSISVFCTKKDLAPKIYICENWEKTKTKPKDWKECIPTFKEPLTSKDVFQKEWVLDFDDLTFSKDILTYILIIHPDIWFLDKSIGDIRNISPSNEHITFEKYGWPMNDFEVFSKVNYYFIGKIKTTPFHVIYSNLIEMNNAYDIYFHIH